MWLVVVRSCHPGRWVTHQRLLTALFISLHYNQTCFKATEQNFPSVESGSESHASKPTKKKKKTATATRLMNIFTLDVLHTIPSHTHKSYMTLSYTATSLWACSHTVVAMVSGVLPWQTHDLCSQCAQNLYIMKIVYKRGWMGSAAACVTYNGFICCVTTRTRRNSAIKHLFGRKEKIKLCS